MMKKLLLDGNSKKNISGSNKNSEEEFTDHVKFEDLSASKKKSEKIHMKSKKRCNLISCKKKLKLTDLICNCDFIFCSRHRLPELHLCSQNLKKKNREKYLKKVQVGGGEVIKIDKI